MDPSASHPRISNLLSVDLEFSSVQTACTDNKDSVSFIFFEGKYRELILKTRIPAFFNDFSIKIFQAIYSKGTQTDDERISVGEFSLGSQEFDYDDDMIMPMDHGQFRGLCMVFFS